MQRWILPVWSDLCTCTLDLSREPDGEFSSDALVRGLTTTFLPALQGRNRRMGDLQWSWPMCCQYVLL
jgi:hypothetical protein